MIWDIFSLILDSKREENVMKEKVSKIIMMDSKREENHLKMKEKVSKINDGFKTSRKSSNDEKKVIVDTSFL